MQRVVAVAVVHATPTTKMLAAFSMVKHAAISLGPPTHNN